jgi:hypothetical protein
MRCFKARRDLFSWCEIDFSIQGLQNSFFLRFYRREGVERFATLRQVGCLLRLASRLSLTALLTIAVVDAIIASGVEAELS